MFGIVFVAIAVLDELCFMMRCRQLRREAREAAELLVQAIERQSNQSLYSVVL